MKNAMSRAVQKKSIFAVSIMVGLIIITLVILSNPAPSPENLTQVNDMAITHATNALDVDTSENTKTIASAWQWEAVPTNENNDHQPEALNIDVYNQSETANYSPFTQESVYKALHAVKLDENGDILIDHDALTALNAALDHNKLKLDDETLDELQDLIRKGLPGNAGEQTAQLVADYYQYLDAKSEFNALYETRSNIDRNIENHEAQYSELLALRELYLGAEVADQLFATTNANSRYMFDSMKLEANTDLSEEEKKQQQAQIIERHAEKTINVNNWNERYRSFSADKQNILNSYLNDDEKRGQLTTIMHQHFSDEELAYVSHLRLDSL